MAKRNREAKDYESGPAMMSEIQFRMANEWTVHEGADEEKGVIDWIDTYGKSIRKLIETQPELIAGYASASEEKKLEIIGSLKEKLYH